MNIKTTITGASLAAIFIIGALFFVFDDEKSGDLLHKESLSGVSNVEHSNKNELETTRNNAEGFRHATENPFSNAGARNNNTMNPVKSKDSAEAEIAFDEATASDDLSETVTPEEPKTNTPDESDDSQALEDLIAQQEAYYLEYVKHSEYNNEQPTPDNAEMPPREQYMEQIDQQMIFEQARIDGYETGIPQPTDTEPTSKNAEITAIDDEYYYEINQERILESAKISGIEINEADSNNPSEANMLTTSDGAYADQISETQPEK